MLSGWVAGWIDLKVEIDKDSCPHLRGISPPEGVLQQWKTLRVELSLTLNSTLTLTVSLTPIPEPHPNREISSISESQLLPDLHSLLILPQS